MTILEDLKSGRLVVVPPVSVKPLEWTNHDGGYWYAKCPVTWKEYGVTLEEGKWWSVWDCAAKPEASAEPIKAAAQADYEARILSALTASTDHTAGLIALVEGMERELGAEKRAALTFAGTIAGIDTQEELDEWMKQHPAVAAAEAERDEAREYVDDVLTWLKDRELYNPRDYEVEGPDLADILTSHEVELCAQADIERSRRLTAEAERDALREALARARADERRACAKAVEDLQKGMSCFATMEDCQRHNHLLWTAMAAINARALTEKNNG